jgi:hypothetical protein
MDSCSPCIIWLPISQDDSLLLNDKDSSISLETLQTAALNGVDPEHVLALRVGCFDM